MSRRRLREGGGGLGNRGCERLVVDRVDGGVVLLLFRWIFRV